MLLTLYSLPEILFLKSHGLKGLYSWGVSWGVAYVPTMQLKKLATMEVSSGISDVAIASVHSEKTRLKKLMIMIIIIKIKNHLLVN